MKLYGRKWKILIMDKNAQEALNISDLHIIFEVRRAREAQNFASVKIYNLTEDTERAIVMEGDRMIIEAGYEAEENEPTQYGVIFDGKIIYPSRQKEGNTDFVLSLLCVDGQNALQKDFISKTVNRGLNQRQILDTVCNASDVVLPQGQVSENLSQQKLSRGKVFFGATRDYVRDVCRGNAATYTVENGKLNVMKISDEAPAEAIVVTPSTGLIGMPSQTQFGANFTLLLNPNIHILSLVKLDKSEINEVTPKDTHQQQTPLDDEWIYQVTDFTHRGDTRGNAWYTECTGISRYGKGALAALMANANQNPIGV